MSAKLDSEIDWKYGREKLLDRMLQSRQYFGSTIPLKIRRKITSSLRTAWSVFLTLILMQYWEWSPISLYLSPVISILASSMYFGLWQENLFKVAYGTIIGAAVGVVIGLAYKIIPLLIVLLFFSLIWINRMPGWDRITTVMSSLGLVLGAIWPHLTEGEFTGFRAYLTAISIIIIPYVITGFSLLFPRLALATYSAKFQALLLCRKLSNMIMVMVKGFFSHDDVDICIAEFDQYHSEIIADFASLKALARHVEHESIIFTSVKDMAASLFIFIEISELVVQELCGLRDMITRISFNKTHGQFATHLKPFLIDLAMEMEITLTIVGEHFDSFDPLKNFISSRIRQSVSDLCNCRFFSKRNHTLRRRMSRFYNVPKSSDLMNSYLKYKHSNIDGKKSDATRNTANSMDMYDYSFTDTDAEHEKGVTVHSAEEHTDTNDSFDSSHHSIQNLFNSTIQHLSKSRNALLYEYSTVRREFIILQGDNPNNSSGDSTAQSSSPAPSKADNVTPMMHLIEEEKHLIEEKQRLADQIKVSRRLASSSLRTEDDLFKHDLEEDKTQLNLLKLSIREETMRLSMHNVGPRIAYMHRLSILVEYIFSFRHALKSHGHSFNTLLFLFSCLVAFFGYFYDTAIYLHESANYIMQQYKDNSKDVRGFFMIMYAALKRNYGVGIKVSSAVTVAAALMLYKVMPFLYQGGVWMTFVTVLIKQDLASSSFLTSVQRLEGTVIGAMYAFLVYRIFTCHDRCSFGVEVPVLVIWVAICGLFREGQQHGYSATVAAFTPIILLLGTTNSEQGAWGRIEETFLGIVIYLVVDNLINPQRTYPNMKVSVLQCIESVRCIFSESVKGVEALVEVENSYSSDQVEEWQEYGPQQMNQEEDVGLYGAAADVRYRSESVTYEIIEGTSSRKNSSVSLNVPSEENDIEMAGAQVNDLATAPKVIQNLLKNCMQHFNEAEKRLKSMKAELARQANLLTLVQYEPELWHRSFPQAAYQRLLNNFERVYRSGVALNSGSRAFMVIMCQMMRKNENISYNLSHFKYMINHLFLVSAKSDFALQKAHEAFKLLYAREEGEIDVSSLLTLRRVCDKLFEAVDEHFRSVYIRLPLNALISLNPYFLVAWQNVFESAQDLIQDLSDLGITLLAVRNIEGLLAL